MEIGDLVNRTILVEKTPWLITNTRSLRVPAADDEAEMISGEIIVKKKKKMKKMKMKKMKMMMIPRNR